MIMTLPKMLPDRVKVYYRHLNSDELAIKYGKTPQAMRQWLHREGIECPRLTQSKRTNALILKLWPRGTTEEIAEYVGLRPSLVRRRYARLTRVLRWVQLALWPADAFKIDAPPMRIVHSARPKVHGPSGQLELFPVELQIKAA